MKSLKIIAAAAAMSMLVGCGGTMATRPLLSFEYASATQSKIDSRAAKSMGEVKSQCLLQGTADYGLMESAVIDALAQAPGATFIKEPKFVQGDRNCVQVSGTAMGPQ